MVQPAVPLAVLGVGKVAEGPLVGLLVHEGVFGLSSERVGECGGDDALTVRPPEFHVLPVFLHGLVKDIPVIKEAAMLGIPPALPHAVEDAQAEAGVAADAA